MSRFILLLLSLTLSVTCLAQPNFVFILADDLGWSELGVYGADLHETPRLDAFAQTGVRFTQAYTASPVCSPTRASILTGRHPARLHITVWREAAEHPPLNRKLVPPIARDHLPHSEVTIAKLLREAGYATAHIGKWHLGTADYYPQNHGFDSNIGGTLWGAPQTFFYPYSGDRYYREPRYVPHLEGGKPGEYLTDRLTDEALEFLDAQGDSPFYLNLWYHTVHTPIEGKPEVVARYAAKIRPDMNHQNAHLAAMVASLDENVGRVLDKLDALGLADNTVVVFTSDNGDFINDWEGERVTNNAPLRSGKGSLYEGGVRVPTLIRAPGVTPAGAVSETPIVSVDFFPTMLALAGLDAPRDRTYDGTNLVPVLRDPARRLEREALFFHYPHYYATTTPVSSVRVGDWKLLHYWEDGRDELFDLASDPGEERDRAADERERTASLRHRLETWLDEVDAQLPR